MRQVTVAIPEGLKTLPVREVDVSASEGDTCLVVGLVGSWVGVNFEYAATRVAQRFCGWTFDNEAPV